MAYPFARTLITRRRDLEAKVEQLIFKDVGSKLAELLLRLGAEHGIENRGLVLGLKITHQEMANLIGSTRETRHATAKSEPSKRGRLFHGQSRRRPFPDELECVLFGRFLSYAK